MLRVSSINQAARDGRVCSAREKQFGLGPGGRKELAEGVIERLVVSHEIVG